MERLRIDVVLVTNKASDLTFAINRLSRGVPRVSFSSGWKAFAASNNFAKGDHLLFNLSGMSQFHVYIFNADGTPKAPSLQSNSELSGDKVRGVAQDEKSQQLPQAEPEGNDADKDHAPSVSHPRFVKRLTTTNFGGPSRSTSLELPADFTRTHGGQLRTLLTLQGISEESTAYRVACSWTPDPDKRLRLYLRFGWMEFWNANHLKVGLVLEFTLTSDSFFVVRERAN